LNTQLLQDCEDDDLLLLDGYDNNDEESKSQTSSLIAAQSENIDRQVVMFESTNLHHQGKSVVSF